MEFFYEYLVFLAEAITIVIAILVVASAIFAMSQRNVIHDNRGRLRVEKINDQLTDIRHAMEEAVLPADQVKKQHKAEAKQAKKASKSDSLADSDEPARRLFCLRFEGDLKASAVDHLRAEVSAILTLAKPADEVVVVVESPGGMVSNYGLAASQLCRFRDADISLTVAVDKVAASGGYLMAAVANKIVAAPFALVGSIGVVAQVPNVHRLLKKNDVDVEVLTAGKHKRTLTLLGENTQEGREKFQEELEEVHGLFQKFVSQYRPQLDMDVVATGEAWYGTRAIELQLVDELATSDDYLMRACDSADAYNVKWEETKKPLDRLMERVNGIAQQIESAAARFAGNDRNSVA